MLITEYGADAFDNNNQPLQLQQFGDREGSRIEKRIQPIWVFPNIRGPNIYSQNSGVLAIRTPTVRLKIAQKPYIRWSLGPKTIEYESLEPKVNT